MWNIRTFGDIFLDGVSATRNFERKFVLCGKYSGRKFVAIVHPFKKIWLNLWFGTALCKTPMEFPATIWVLRVTYVVCNHGNTQCINCVDAFGIMTYITGSVANLPWSGRPQKLSMEANSVYVRTVHNKYWQKTSEFTQKYGNVTKILIVSAVTYQYSVFCCEM